MTRSSRKIAAGAGAGETKAETEDAVAVRQNDDDDKNDDDDVSSIFGFSRDQQQEEESIPLQPMMRRRTIARTTRGINGTNCIINIAGCYKKNTDRSRNSSITDDSYVTLLLPSKRRRITSNSSYAGDGIPVQLLPLPLVLLVILALISDHEIESFQISSLSLTTTPSWSNANCLPTARSSIKKTTTTKTATSNAFRLLNSQQKQRQIGFADSFRCNSSSSSSFDNYNFESPSSNSSSCNLSTISTSRNCHSSAEVNKENGVVMQREAKKKTISLWSQRMQSIIPGFVDLVQTIKTRLFINNKRKKKKALVVSTLVGLWCWFFLFVVSPFAISTVMNPANNMQQYQQQHLGTRGGGGTSIERIVRSPLMSSSVFGDDNDDFMITTNAMTTKLQPEADLVVRKYQRQREPNQKALKTASTVLERPNRGGGGRAGTKKVRKSFPSYSYSLPSTGSSSSSVITDALTSTATSSHNLVVRDVLEQYEKQEARRLNQDNMKMERRAYEIEQTIGRRAANKYRKQYDKHTMQQGNEKAKGLIELKRNLLRQGIDPMIDLEGQREVVFYLTGIDLSEIPNTPHNHEKRRMHLQQSNIVGQLGSSLSQQLQDKIMHQPKGTNAKRDGSGSSSPDIVSQSRSSSSYHQNKQHHRQIIACLVQDLEARGIDPLQYFENDHPERISDVWELNTKEARQMAQLYTKNLQKYGRIASLRITVSNQLETFITKTKKTISSLTSRSSPPAPMLPIMPLSSSSSGDSAISSATSTGATAVAKGIGIKTAVNIKKKVLDTLIAIIATTYRYYGNISSFTCGWIWFIFCLLACLSRIQKRRSIKK